MTYDTSETAYKLLKTAVGNTEIYLNTNTFSNEIKYVLDMKLSGSTTNNQESDWLMNQQMEIFVFV